VDGEIVVHERDLLHRRFVLEGAERRHVERHIADSVRLVVVPDQKGREVKSRTCKRTMVAHLVRTICWLITSRSCSFEPRKR
jgi:hypothetical protein